jgi:hypothetical protein
MSRFHQAVFEQESLSVSLSLSLCPKRMRGENGHVSFSQTGLGSGSSSLLALFDKHFQGISEIDLRSLMFQVLFHSQEREEERGQEREEERGKKRYRENCELNSSEKIEMRVNLFLLCFHTRWCRGGKGAKLPFYQAIKILYEVFPIPVIRLIPLIPQYGYWKDLLLLLQHIKDFPVSRVDYEPLRSAVWDIYAQQLLDDYEKLQKGNHSDTNERLELSGAGKYAPREKKEFDISLNAVSQLCKRMFPSTQEQTQTSTSLSTTDVEKEKDLVTVDEVKRSSSTLPPPVTLFRPKKRYREIITALNRALDVPEVKMCSNRFSLIKMSVVPSLCMKRNKAAFANELLDHTPFTAIAIAGNRHPDISDRVQCRKNLLETLSSKGQGVKGAQLYPHEYVEEVFNDPSLSMVKKLVLDSQWTSLRESIHEMVKKRREATNMTDVDIKTEKSKTLSNNISLGNLIPLSDVSGSMSGTPMMVSIGLGILCSELAHESFRDLVMTFSGSASWECLHDCHSFVDKVGKLRKAHWEGNTNFYNALSRVSDIVREKRLKQEEIPNLLVISDMQFDMATHQSSSWNSVYENIEEMYRELGMSICGVPYTPPIIIFWNVRANTVGFPVNSDQKGVMMLSGYSPSLMKFILSGEFEEEIVVETSECQDHEDEVPILKKKKIIVSPMDTLKKVLGEDIFNPLREILNDPSMIPHMKLGNYDSLIRARVTDSTARANRASTRANINRRGRYGFAGVRSRRFGM